MPARQRKTKIDYILLVLASILIVWGIFTVATTSFSISLKNFDNSWHYALHQILWGVIPGLVGALVLLKTPTKFLKKWSLVILGLNLGLVLMVFVPHLGVKLGGARRWLQLGPIVFQPSEILKITSLLYLSAWLSSEKKKGKQGLVVFGAVLAMLGIGLLLQPDMSTLGIIIFAALLIYFAAPTPWWHILILGVVLIVTGVALMAFTPYRAARILTFLNPETDPLGMGYQAKQALISIGSGEILGINQGFGFGLSRQKTGFLPYPMSDSMFAVIGEELGFVGSFCLLSLFLAFIWRGLILSKRASDKFSELLGVGIMAWLGGQTLFHIGGLLGLLPLSGIPLPFFSYGASHLITEVAAIGLLLKISKN